MPMDIKRHNYTRQQEKEGAYVSDDKFVRTTIWLPIKDLKVIKEKAKKKYGGNVSLYLRSIGTK